MSLVICIHNTYNTVEITLAHDNNVIAHNSISKELASASLIPMINALLICSHHALSDISHIIVNQGPAPFTTLRTVIVTANGIAFAHKIPIIGVDGLDACMQEYGAGSIVSVVLLNAFNKAVYYGITDSMRGETKKGYASIESCLDMIQSMYRDMYIQFLGNGTDLYRKEIESIFKGQAHIPDPLPLTASCTQILNTGIKQLQTGKSTVYFIEPLYLKKPLS